MRKLLTVLISLNIMSINVNAQPIPTLDVAEEDGSPIVYNPYEIKFSNGIVEDNADGTVSILGYTSTPTNADDSCTVGQWSAATGWYYACVDTDTWQRVALATWSVTDKLLLDNGTDKILLDDGTSHILIRP